MKGRPEAVSVATEPNQRADHGCLSGRCRDAGNSTGDAFAYCKGCHPGVIERRWTRDRVVEATLDRRRRYGRLPSSYDWSRTHVRRRWGKRCSNDWPAANGRPRAWSATC